MKISTISDLHLNISLYKGVLDKLYSDLPFRTVDFMKAFEYNVDQNINVIKPDLIVIAGDVYETFDPSNIVSGFFNGQLRKLNDAKIPVIILVGNHDICRKHHALKPLAALGLKWVKVFESPSIVFFKDVVLALFPYSMEVERKLISIKDQFHSFVNELKLKIASDEKFKDKEVLFFGHFGVRGANINQYTEYLDDVTNVTTTSKIQTEIKRNYVNSNDKDISLEDLDTIGAKYVFLGDYHRHQVLNTKKCISMYTGSIEKSDMSEMDQKKGFILYDTDATEKGNMGKCVFIDYPHCRPMIELKGTLREIEEQFKENGKDKKGAIVKVTFIGNNDELTAFSIGFESFKKKMRDTIDPVHVYSQMKVIDDEENNAASALEQEILDRGHVQSDDVIDVVGDLIAERG
jgi:DNA repair exonuclease SbcCD nuclease subunit